MPRPLVDPVYAVATPLRRRAGRFAWTLACLLLLGGSARAQSRAISVNLFEPALGTPNFLNVHSGDVLGHKQLALQLFLDYQHNPATLSEARIGSGGSVTLGNERTALVSREFRLYLGGAVGLGDIAQIGLAVPVVLNLHTPASQVGPMGTQASSTAAFGDLYLEGKVRLIRSASGFALALLPGITLPTGDDEAFAGDSTVTGRIRAALSVKRRRFAAATNVGALFRDSVVIARGDANQEISISHQLLYGAAASYDFTSSPRPIVGIVEISGRHGFDAYLDSAPLEADAAVRFGLPLGFGVTVGGGAGIIRGIGSPTARAFAGLTWAPNYSDRDRDGVADTEDQCPDQLEDRDGFRDDDGCPESDNDGDGMEDGEDRCPNEAEDLDGVEDEDGCPDGDNDKDGIPDLNDACPNAPEDGKGKLPKDGCPFDVVDTDRDGVPDIRDKCPEEAEDPDKFQDEDGCPDPDNDTDGVPDSFDECPQNAEDQDGFEDEDGCPDPDNDKDGVSDLQDRCPTEPETINGIQDGDGCPDQGASHVSLSETEVLVDAPLLAKKGKPRELKTLLDQVALMIIAHPELDLIKIQTHRQRGETQTAAMARAATIKRHLVGKGVASARLETQTVATPGPPTRLLIEKRAEPKPSKKHKR